jgi:hypothetical protein
MLTIQSEELVRRLRAGHLDPAGIEALDQTSPREILSCLEGSYRIRFQERQFKDKWEISLAESLSYLVAPFSRSSLFPILLMVPVFRNCLFLSGERDKISGISVATRLMVKPSRMPVKGITLTTGKGFKIDKGPDGWSIKPLEKRTVKLTEEFLQKRGWRFEVLRGMTLQG